MNAKHSIVHNSKHLNDYSIFGIGCDKYNNEEKYSEMLGLRFKNNFNDKCNVFILNAGGKLEMKVGDSDYETFDIKELAVKIIDILN